MRCWVIVMGLNGVVRGADGLGVVSGCCVGVDVGGNVGGLYWDGCCGFVLVFGLFL